MASHNNRGLPSPQELAAFIQDMPPMKRAHSNNFFIRASFTYYIKRFINLQKLTLASDG